DLARFLLQTLSHLLRGKPPAQRWIAKLDVHDMRLADRLESYRSALAFVKHAEVLQRWQEQARTVGYFEEGYAARQLWKADWEAHDGDELCQHAQTILHEIEPLKP